MKKKRNRKENAIGPFAQIIIGKCVCSEMHEKRRLVKGTPRLLREVLFLIFVRPN